MAVSQAVDSSGSRQDGYGSGDATRYDSSNASKAVDSAKAGASELGRAASHAVDAAKQGVNEAKGFAHEKLDEAKQAAVQTADSLKSTISNNPWASIGIAAGLGMLIGLIAFRSRS